MNAQPPPQPEPLLVVILGPTASGKSALAIHLAQQFAGEVVSCDSVALYRYFEIGTAKPTREQRALVPHHLLDVAEPDQPFTAGEYARQARAIIDEIARRRHLPIVVGGTGLYLRALLEGLFPGPQRSEELRERLRASAAERGSPYLHRLLTRLDPDSGIEDTCQRFAEADPRHRGLPGVSGADERAMEAARTRSPARLSGSADRAQPAAREAVRTHQPARCAHVRGWSSRGNEVATGAIRLETRPQRR